MPRIPYPDPATLPEAVRNSVARAPINVVRMMAGTSQGVFEGFNKFSGAFYGPASSLPPALREVAIDGVPELEAEYREWIPVVEIDGQRRFVYHVHPDALRRAVAQAAS